MNTTPGCLGNAGNVARCNGMARREAAHTKKTPASRVIASGQPSRVPRSAAPDSFSGTAVPACKGFILCCTNNRVQRIDIRATSGATTRFGGANAMQRLTSPGYNAPGPVDREEAARSAAIASMAFRLAAAGPRTRQRLVDRESVPEPPLQGRTPPALPEAPQSSQLRQPPYVPFHEPLAAMDRYARPGASGTLRVFAALGATASCGFGLVLAMQSPHWAALHHLADGIPLAQHAPRVLPAIELRPSPPSLVTAALAAPPRVEAPASIDVAAAAEGDSAVAPIVRQAGPTVRSKAALVAEPAPNQYAESARPHPRPPHAAPVMVRLAEPKPREAHPAALARFDLPRWLTEDHPPKPKTLVMSEPPHDLVPPPGATPVQPAPVQAPVARAAPRAVIYASPSPANPLPLRAPGYRPFYPAPYSTYYGPYYPPAPAKLYTRSAMASGTTDRQYPQAPSNGW